MALILKSALSAYKYVFEESRDKRLDGYFLMSSPIPIVLLCISYLYFVLKCGPKFMEKRKPFQLERIIIIYNIAQVVINSYMVVKATPLLLKMNVYCSEVDYTNNPDALLLMKLTHLYFVVKVLDLFDTIFFILRKKYNQVSFLHVYHHVVMVMAVWLATNFVAGGHSIYLGYINCIVHAIMYSYYLLTVYDPVFRQSIWWKKHITQIQLLQFSILFIIYTNVLLNPDCGYSKIFSYTAVSQNIFMLFLFGDFYRKTYLKAPKTALKKAES